MTASSSMDSSVDLGSFGPVERSATELRFFHFTTVFGLIPIPLEQRPQALSLFIARRIASVVVAQP